MAPSRQQARQAFERFSAHHHRCPHGYRLESLEIRRDVPGQLACPADDPAERAGDDERDARSLVHDRDLPRGDANAK
jgi:hypothetical protein